MAGQCHTDKADPETGARSPRICPFWPQPTTGLRGQHEACTPATCQPGLEEDAAVTLGRFLKQRHLVAKANSPLVDWGCLCVESRRLIREVLLEVWTGQVAGG